MPALNWMVQALANYHLGRHDIARRLAEHCRIGSVSAMEQGAMHPHERLGAEFLHNEVERQK